ncbi:VOC family protein [uncultured Kriegella sp.]|uniref:VOC family protein n=1 Tax=uncultured Kriegella sp. TaxID=1798910 RepID=UPI0030DDA16B|tara:strand:+ start:39686 stop:40750 length:1065 start_codon:yes stop_codon:yes gene_type:complete
MKEIINGIQQIGIGVADAKEVFNWYRKYLGFDILVFQDEATAGLMTKYTNNTAYSRLAMLALNMVGGGGLEIWQYKDRIPEASKTPILLGDLGINVMKLRSNAIEETYKELKALQLSFLTELHTTEVGRSHFFFEDPWGNLVEVVADNYCFCSSKSASGGVLGVVVGVSDMDASIDFYKHLLGFDHVVYNKKGVFQDFCDLPSGKASFQRVLLKRSTTAVGGFGELFGPAEIELIQTEERKPDKIYKDRLWGDLGYIHLCFDVHGMQALREHAKSLNFPFTVDSADSFDMGAAAGHFSYVEDPDGTLIEFVETHKVPVLKKLGIYIDLKKRNPQKPLSKWLVKAMQVHRVRSDR